MKKKIFIIAEVGINHNGSLFLAKKLIDAAVNVGADAVKFQTFDTESEMSINTKKLVYQKVKINKNLSLYNYTKKLEFDKIKFQILFDYAKKKKNKNLFIAIRYKKCKTPQKLKSKNMENCFKPY